MVEGLELPLNSYWVANQGGLRGLFREQMFLRRGPNAGCLSSLRALRPRLLHAHFGPDACDALSLARALEIPLVATIHGYDATLRDEDYRRTRFGRRYLRRRDRMARSAAMVLPVSDFLRKSLTDRGFPSDRVRTHYTGVDTQLFRPPDKPARRQEVLFVARLTEKKGCSFLIKAMAFIQQSHPDVELIVIGDGEERRELESEARRSLRRYTFLGAQPPNIIVRHMQRASLFSVPSLTAANGDAEGFGMVFAEAQACGLPVVSFSSGGVPEAVAHGETGFLAPEKDWRGLGQYISLLLDDRDLWQRFSIDGRRRTECLFDLAKQTAILEATYDDIIRDHAATSRR